MDLFCLDILFVITKLALQETQKSDVSKMNDRLLRSGLLDMETEIHCDPEVEKRYKKWDEKNEVSIFNRLDNSESMSWHVN